VLSIPPFNIIAHPDGAEDDISFNSFEGFDDDEDDEELAGKMEDAALEESRQFAAYDEVYKESQKCIDEGKVIVGEIAKSGDAIMGDKTAHMKRAADRTVKELDDDKFGEMNDQQ
jgi:hypothetical protein